MALCQTKPSLVSSDNTYNNELEVVACRENAHVMNKRNKENNISALFEK